MASAKVWCRLEVEIDGVSYTLGRRQTDAPYSLSVDGNIADLSKDVGTETTVTLFDIANDLGDFDLLMIESDQDVVIELTVDKDGSVGTEYLTFGIKGGSQGKPGVPFILARDDAYANYTNAFAGGTLDVIQVVKVRNLSDTDTAHVRALAVT